MSTPGLYERAAESRPARQPRLQSIAALINPVSGSVRAGAEAELRALVAAHGYQLRLFTIGNHNVEQMVREAVSNGPDLLVVLAGDGTARLAADLCGPGGPLLAPLPGGTMNMLPHALYGTTPWRHTLEAILGDGVERPVSGGRICGRNFYVAAILGAPALWGRAREALRSGNLVEAVRRVNFAFRRAFAGGLNYGAEGHAGHSSEALMLICPLVSKVMDEERALELAALDVHDGREAVRLAFSGLVGGWRRDPAVSSEFVQRGWATMRGSIPSILDGETHRLSRRAEFEFVPRAFRALAPRASAAARP
jgi:diacylglycerol kinase family enzyme